MGEIDIIAESNENVVVYCEVKYRSSEKNGHPLEAVDVKKQKRICNTALVHYSYEKEAQGKCCRFDVIGIDEDGQIRHIENAFEYRR